MRRAIMFLFLIVVAAGILGFEAGLYQEFQKLFPASSSAAHDSRGHTNSTSNILVNTVFNYGNATSIWINQTSVPVNSNFYNLTLRLAAGRVDALYSSEYSEHQVLGINGVEQNQTYYWSIWKFCPGYRAWALTPVGADLISLTNGGIYGWYYQKQTGTQYPPVAGAPTVTILDINSC